MAMLVYRRVLKFFNHSQQNAGCFVLLFFLNVSPYELHQHQIDVKVVVLSRHSLRLPVNGVNSPPPANSISIVVTWRPKSKIDVDVVIRLLGGSSHLGASKNRGIPKWMVYNGKPN